MKAWIGLGGNQGRPLELLPKVMKVISESEAISLSAKSSLYRTAPQDYVDQSDFINAVVRIETELSAMALLDTMQSLENLFGRTRNGPRFGPRLIDLDLLMTDGDAVNNERLVLPHPRMHQRAFVLAPLAEIDPELEIPGHGPVQTLLAQCTDQRVERVN